MAYQRLPGPGSKSFDCDGQLYSIDGAGAWPAVGRSSLVFFDDPNDLGIEQWRICSTIRSIACLAPTLNPNVAVEISQRTSTGSQVFRRSELSRATWSGSR